MTRELEKSEWTGFRGKVGGWLLNSPLRHLLEITILGNSPKVFLSEVSKIITTGNETVLDVGAGSGFYSLRIAKKLRSGLVICLDLSKEMLVHLEKKALKKGLTGRIKILQSPAGSMELADGSVDLVVSNAVFHELSEPELAMKEMVRVLKTGGWIIINDFRNIRGRHGHGKHSPYSIEEFENLFSQNKLTEIRIFPVKRWVMAVGKKLDQGDRG